MPEARSRRLMRLGYRAGAELAIGFDLNAHRVRRALASYQEIERVAEVFRRTWTNGRLHTSLRSAGGPIDSPAWDDAKSRALILKRFGQLASWAVTLRPGDPQPSVPPPPWRAEDHAEPFRRPVIRLLPPCCQQPVLSA